MYKAFHCRVFALLAMFTCPYFNKVTETKPYVFTCTIYSDLRSLAQRCKAKSSKMNVQKRRGGALGLPVSDLGLREESRAQN
jgi:hypothetical protein